MRILHTSDWHLGQNLMGKSREAEHRAFLDWLLDLLATEDINTLLVAGDVFDTGTPPSYARELYHQFFVSLHQRQLCQQVILLGGNHDSVAVLNESRGLLDCLNITVVAGVLEHPADHVLPLTDLQGVQWASLCAVPYIRPRDVVLSRAGASLQEKQHNLQRGIQTLYQRIFEIARERTAPDLPIIGSGHFTLSGGQSGDSERSLYIGNLEAYPATKLPHFDYLALGHLHRAQSIGEGQRQHYCGSPIPLSFSEAKQEKSVSIIDWSDADPQRPHIRQIAVPRTQTLFALKGNLSELKKQLQALPAPPEGQRHWLEVTVEQDTHLSDLQHRLQALVEPLPVDLLCTRRARKSSEPLWQANEGAQLQELDAGQVFEQCLNDAEIDPALQSSLTQLYQQLLHDVLEERT